MDLRPPARPPLESGGADAFADPAVAGGLGLSQAAANMGELLGSEASDASLGQAQWATACLVAALFALDPAGFGGIHVRAKPGPVRDRWLARLQALLACETPLRKCPAGVADDRLLGGLDLPATLSAGRPVVQRGLLAEADGGVLLLPMAERWEPGAIARLTGVMDQGAVQLAREGFTASLPAAFGVVAFDEGETTSQGAPETIPAPLRDRLAFRLDLDGIAWRDMEGATNPFDLGRENDHVEEDVAGPLKTASRRVGEVTCAAPLVESLVATAAALGIGSFRPVTQALLAARALAALEGQDTVDEAAARLAAQLVLAPRASQLPAPETPAEAEEASSPEEPGPEEEPAGEDISEQHAPHPDDLPEEGLNDRILQATEAAIPADLLARLTALAPNAGLSSAQGAREQGGKQGTVRASKQRGRPRGTRPGDPRRGERLHLVDTLRSAAPWQKLRSQTASSLHQRLKKVHVRADDFRVKRFQEPETTTTIFAVDASGSQALNRLAEAKGAVELLLSECYVRRDQVALIGFRATQADLLLPPTRSLVRAKRSLAGLPGGGGTPLASGLEAARALSVDVRRRGATPLLVILTDGQANVGLSGKGGRRAAFEEALQVARSLACENIRTLFIDTAVHHKPGRGRKPSSAAHKTPAKGELLAEAMGAQYLALPHADAITLSAAVQLAGHGAGGAQTVGTA